MSKNSMDCFVDGWKKTFVYNGTASRKEFWLFILINVLGILLIFWVSYFVLVNLIADHTSRGGMQLVWAFVVYFPLRGLAPLILLAPIVALGIRRMHDTGRSGWWFGGALLVNLLILPLILAGVSQSMDTFFNGASGRQIMEVLSITLSSAATIYTVWLCCIPTKTQK